MHQVSTMLLEVIETKGEMGAKEFLEYVPRLRGDYTDFFPAAALLDGGYLDSNTFTPAGSEPMTLSVRQTAITMQQVMTPTGESFVVDGAMRDSWSTFPLKYHLTAKGYAKLDEIDARRAQERQVKWGYWVSIFVAIIVALLTAVFDHLINGSDSPVSETTAQELPQVQRQAESLSVKSLDSAPQLTPAPPASQSVDAHFGSDVEPDSSSTGSPSQ